MKIAATEKDPRRKGAGIEAWQQDMRAAIRDPYVLCDELNLPRKLARGAHGASAQFPLFVPRPYLSRMAKSDPGDPLLRQVMPARRELDETPGFDKDPVGDLPATAGPGVIRKYKGRCLLVVSGACPVHCRYCFRRHFPYSASSIPLGRIQDLAAQIGQDPDLHEVILSGGDPLTVTDGTLAELVRAIEPLPSVRRIRIHTRFPIMIPNRITDKFVQILSGTRLVPIVVIHANHPNEIDSDVTAALARLHRAGILLMNQSVLLKGINDQVEILRQLSEKLIAARVQPYYLHQLDRVTGAAHFEVPASTGRRLIAALRESLSGYAVPRYVQEIAGRKSKDEIL